VAAREVGAGRNWRNLRVLVVLGVLIAGNVTFHAEVYLLGRADYGIRIGIAAVIVLITLVGGRIVPSFTHNWLARREKGRLPGPFFAVRKPPGSPAGPATAPSPIDWSSSCMSVTHSCRSASPCSVPPFFILRSCRARSAFMPGPPAPSD